MFFFMMNFTHNRTIYREETSQELFPRKFKNEKRLCILDSISFDFGILWRKILSRKIISILRIVFSFNDRDMLIKRNNKSRIYLS